MWDVEWGVWVFGRPVGPCHKILVPTPRWMQWRERTNKQPQRGEGKDALVVHDVEVLDDQVQVRGGDQARGVQGAVELLWAGG